MPEKMIIVHKKLGETPLEALEKARIQHGLARSVPMTYAGRLDPMAEGVLILLVGDECKNKQAYLGLDKTYEFEILVGFETDTYDLLGLVVPSEDKISASGEPTRGPEILSSDFALVLKSFAGTFIQKYPSFSSKTVGGRQLFQLSKDEELPIEMPEHEVNIFRLDCISERNISKESLHIEIIRRIQLVHGDFRQEEIITLWRKTFDNAKEKEYKILSCVCKCSSGTYIRQLVADISEKIGIPMVTYSIKRTQVGEL